MSPRLFPLSLAIFIVVFVPPTFGADPRGDNPDAPSSTPAEQLKKFHVPPGFEVQLVAAEPQIQKPINLTFDAAGRLWVTGSELYPWPASVDALGQPIPDFEKGYADIASAFRVGDKAPPASKVAKDAVRILSDFAPDGAARKIEVFADGLNIPSGVQPLPRKAGAKGDAAIVYSIPNIWRLEDTDGDGKADKREVLYGMFGYLDTHGGSSSYLYWIDGWIYGTHGFRNHSEVRDRNGKVTVLDSGNTYRFRPDGSAFEIYTHGQTNPFGLTVDPYGNFYSADSHSKPVYMLLRGGYYEGIGKQHDGLGFAPRITDDDHGSSAIAGIAYYADDKFPEEYRGNLFNGNPVTQKINRDKLEWHGSTPKAIRQPDFVTCDDPWFRPVQVKLGPDGALYIADFYNPIIGHYEFPLTDPRRDHTHGRIWRVVWRGENKEAPPATAPDLTKLDGSALARQFESPNLEVRRMATNELVDRIGAEEAVPSLRVAVGNTTIGSPFHVENAMWAYARLGSEKHAFDYIGYQTNFMGLQAAKMTTEKDVPNREDLDKWIGWLKTSDKRSQRAIVEIFCRHSSPKNLPALVSFLSTVPSEDTELIYTLRMAIRNALDTPEGYKFANSIVSEHPENGNLFVDVFLAIKTPESAQFLLTHLEQTKLQAPRAGEFLKHALLNLPEEKLGSLLQLIGQADQTSSSQKLALATNLTDAARQRNLALPADVSTWAQKVILDAITSGQDDLTKPAIASLRDSKSDAKLAPLAAIVCDDKRDGTLRLSALEATANLPAARELLVSTFQGSRHMILRKRAAELLAQGNQNVVLLTALPNAPEELAISIYGALARSDAGATGLLDLIGAGKSSPRLLLNKAVAGPLIARPKPIRDRAQGLVKDLPPEDARLNAVIAERAAAFAKAQPDAAHGAQVFQQTCAACHRFRNAGGNIGPNLDGVVARGPARVIEDILDPNRNVDPLFRQTTIETTDGETILGGNVRDQGATLVLSDLTGKDVTVQKSRIKKQTVSPVSLMPPVFEAAISAKDFYDLLGYLLSPTVAP